ncbi:MAG: DUF2079 domain-containing protein, partial [Sedimentisphaerales bacterium]|nr:DUF2079 domain-containing protein [Sedimentisphaerales bacterium]
MLSFGLLLSPFLWNTALFEFHAIAFALPLLFWLVVAYEKQRYWLFLLIATAVLLIREDMGLVIAGVGIVAALEHRGIRWIVIPVAIGGAWFVAATQLSGYLSGYGGYKFLAYYGHLGDSLGGIVKNLALHPWIVLESLFGFRAILFMLGLFLPFFFLPFGRPKWLIPMLPPLFAFLLSRNNAEIILRIHYPIAMVPFLFLALRDVLAAWNTGRGRIVQHLREYQQLAIISIGIAFIYSFLVMSPIIGIAHDLPGKLSAERTRLLRAVAAELPTTSGIAAGYSMLPNIATRSALVSLHYVFSGKQQFSERTYMPVPVDMIVMDPKDIIFYNATND